MNKKMTIYLSPSDGFGTSDLTVQYKDQTVRYVNIFDGNTIPELPKGLPMEYGAADKSKAVVLLNYTELKDPAIAEREGYSTVRGSDALTLDVFKQEIDRIPKEGEPDAEALTSLEIVAQELQQYHFKDYNVSNGRKYRYVIYPGQADNEVQKLTANVPVNWDYWSLTELTPIDGSWKSFAASSDNVWLFNLNVETGEQAQNIARNEQQTLSTYSRFSQGKMNYVSGSVSCLLGRDVIPAYLAKSADEAGYQEKLWNDRVLSSNQKVDMLLAWRKFVFSSNPKLLKDRFGQSFIVTLTQSSNKPMDNVRRQPNTISFSWTEVASLKDVTIIEAL